MDTVFVWVSYGDAKVYAGDTKEDVLTILKAMSEVNEAVGEEPYDLEKLSKRMDDIGVAEMRKRINASVYQIVQKSDDDRYDWGSGFAEIEKMGSE